MTAAMLAAVFLRLGWRGGLDCLALHHLTVLAPPPVWRETVLIFAILALLADLVVRVLQRWMRDLELTTSRCLILGANEQGRSAIDLIRRHPEAGLRVVGLLQCGKEAGAVGTVIDGHLVVGTDVALERLVRLQRIDKLIVAVPGQIERELLRRLRSLRYQGLELADYVSLHEELTREISLEHINEEWLFAASMHSSRFHIRRLKRLIDVVASLAGLILTAPISALSALLIYLDSRGPVLYRQERLGCAGLPFTMLKFRTMRTDAENGTGPVWAADHDPRITRVGAWLRRFRIDELPQLINVLRGEMSLVGPRPERAAFVRQLIEQVPFYAERLMVRPGLTGWAQVAQPYAASIEESRAKLRADLYYIKHMSLLTDVYICLKTIRIVLLGRERVRTVGAGVIPRLLGEVMLGMKGLRPHPRGTNHSS